jgi:hypothetical protein
MAIEQNQPIYKQEPPSFNCSMEISYLEKIGACTNEIAANPEDTLDSIIDCFTKNKEEEREIIQNTGDEIGPGRGFTGDELLSKDELNLILDLEDESMRTGQFDRIFPMPTTAHRYYGFFENKRYENALYCAWLSTGTKAKTTLLTNNILQYYNKK